MQVPTPVTIHCSRRKETSMLDSHQVCKGKQSQRKQQSYRLYLSSRTYHAAPGLPAGPRATSTPPTLCEGFRQGLPLAGRRPARRLCTSYGDSWSSPRRRLERKPFIPHCCFVGYATSNSERCLHWPGYRRRGPQM